jgi:putative DNA primase/helicase
MSDRVPSDKSDPENFTNSTPPTQPTTTTIPEPSRNGDTHSKDGSIHPEDPAYPWPPGVTPVKMKHYLGDGTLEWWYAYSKGGSDPKWIVITFVHPPSAVRMRGANIKRENVFLLDGSPLPPYEAPEGEKKRKKKPKRKELYQGDGLKHPIHQTPWGNSRTLVLMFGDIIRYCHPWKCWMIWDGSRWVRDDKGKIIELAKRTVVSLWEEAWSALGEASKRPEGDEKAEAMAEAKRLLSWAISSECKSQIENMIYLAQSAPPIPILPGDFDQDPYLFNCANGTIDLRSGRLREHRKEDFLTKISPVEFDPKARAPRWEQFEREIFLETRKTRPEDSVALYMRRKIGYALSALDELQEMDLLYGEGSNGKNVYLETCKEIFGDYAIVSEPELLLKHRNERHPTGVADLAGARLVLTSETGDGMEFAEAMMRRLTGDKFIKSRRICENFFEFRRTFKIVVATNDKPSLKVANHANFRRLRIVPFQATFEQAGVEIAEQGNGPPKVMREDLKLKDKLMAEAPGILNLFVKGFLQWQRDGLKPPEVVTAATQEYQDEQSNIGDFISRYFDSFAGKHDKQGLIDNRIMYPAGKLHEDYVAWCKDNAISPLSKNAIGRQLTKAGYELYESNGNSYRLGLKLKMSVPTTEPID